MPAEFEETVVAADFFDAQQLLPQCGEHGFAFALRRFIKTAGKRVGAGYRQCVSIQLTVDGQWQRIELDECAGHHEVRKAFEQLPT